MKIFKKIRTVKTVFAVIGVSTVLGIFGFAAAFVTMLILKKRAGNKKLFEIEELVEVEDLDKNDNE